MARKLNAQVSFDDPNMNHSVKWEREYMSISVTQIIHIATSRLSVTGRNPWTKSSGTDNSFPDNSICTLDYNKILKCIVLYYDIHLSMRVLTWVFSRSFTKPYALLSILNCPDGTDCDEVRFPVHGCWDSRDLVWTF